MERKSILGKMALLSCAVIWGSSFFLMKNTIKDIPFNLLLTVRFWIGAIVIAFISRKRLHQINYSYIKSGAILGSIWFWAYWFQTIGLKETTPGKNAFLTAIYCVAVPYITWIVKKKKPTKEQMIAGILCFIGIGLLSLDGNLTMGRGEFLTIICGILFSIHIFYLGNTIQGKDTMLLTMMQFLFAGSWAAIVSIATENYNHIQVSTGMISSMAYLVFMCTIVAVCFQSFGQKNVNSSAASLILSFEAVFGVLFSVIFYGEKATLKIVLGFVFVMAAVLVSETNIFEKSKKKEQLQYE
ncbi:MAG: DMT family transporter [Anaerostipes sp.]|nr:DMT family transporter [Anaerostipes sp.]